MSNARTHTMCAPLTVPYLLIFTSLPHSGENQSPSGVRDPLGVFFFSFHFILFIPISFLVYFYALRPGGCVTRKKIKK